MAMTVMHNTDAQFSLGALNKNSKDAIKALGKVSSGMKINSAQDDASAYSISERMRVLLRGFNQDTQNVQNGSSMVKVAERGIDQIIQNLRALKEKAINAANDSNTDEDRATIQKECDQIVNTIEDIAIGTQYNGKILLDGRYAQELNMRKVEDIVGGIKPGDSNTVFNLVEDPPTRSYKSQPSSQWSFEVDKSFGRPVGISSGSISVELDFNNLPKNIDYPEHLNGKGFTILCDGCMQYINVVFDAELTTEESSYRTAQDDPTLAKPEGFTTANSYAREYIIGIEDVESKADLAVAIFNGVKAAISNNNSSYTTANPTANNTETSLLLDKSHNLTIVKNGDKIFITKDSLDIQLKNGLVGKDDEEEKTRFTGPLWIQHGTQSNQRTNIYINSMQVKDLKNKVLSKSDKAQLAAWSNSPEKQTELQEILNAAKNMTLVDAKVTTVQNARIAIRVIEGALEYSLDQATNMGAYLQRMEYTGLNITTMSENVQSTESVIRDADMAKEMTNYTKSNLLMQAAQSMLAQANQNGSAVLGLLQ